MTVYLLKAIGFAQDVMCPHEGQYLETFDFEYENGLGQGTFTKDPSRAKQFPSFGDAFEFWRTQSKARELRPDGKPNRPMTALSITIEKYEPGEAA